jgi:hypothetical protein
LDPGFDWTPSDRERDQRLPAQPAFGLLRAVLGPPPEQTFDIRVSSRISVEPQKNRMRFASMVLDAEVVPIESSPLHGERLSRLMEHSPAALVTRALAAQTGEPLLVLATPVAMIVFGAARGVARGLDAGLEAKVLELLGVKQRDASERRRSHGRQTEE